MPKQKTIAQLVNRAAERLQLLVRLKAADDSGYVRCVTCGVVRKYNDGMHGGHFISRKKLAHKLLEENIHPQCAKCNGPLRGNMAKYTLYMQDMYGREFVEELINTQDEGRKYIRDELSDLISQIDHDIKMQHKRIGEPA